MLVWDDMLSVSILLIMTSISVVIDKPEQTRLVSSQLQWRLAMTGPRAGNKASGKQG